MAEDVEISHSSEKDVQSAKLPSPASPTNSERTHQSHGSLESADLLPNNPSLVKSSIVTEEAKPQKPIKPKVRLRLSSFPFFFFLSLSLSLSLLFLLPLPAVKQSKINIVIKIINNNDDLPHCLCETLISPLSSCARKLT